MSNSQCGICHSSNRGAIDTALKDGMSLRECARTFGFGRGQVFRHSKNCLGRVRSVAEEARRQAKIKFAEVSGDLDAAFASAMALKKRAEEANDLPQILKCERHIARLIHLRQKQAGKLPSEIKIVPGRPPVEAVDPRIVFPDDADDTLIERFGGQRISEIQPPTVRTLRNRVCWQDTKAPEDSAELEAQLRFQAEISDAKEPDSPV